ncbi:MAG: LysM peptidoglycan-binding domain-containing protein [Chloroflexi bacterium]|nr:LysM peptidoglycan-binding domain-containing protein [Chloroflexota bacterium]
MAFHRYPKRYIVALMALISLIAAALACSLPGSDNVIEITATPLGGLMRPTETRAAPTETPIRPTPNPTRVSMQASNGTYTVQPGDTLQMIAARFAVPLDTLAQANGIVDVNQLEVGQTLQIPSTNQDSSTGFKIIPDSEVVFGPSASDFDVAAYLKLRPGFLRVYSEEINGELWSGVEIINRVATDYSVNPRLLLALLEYQSGWLSNPTPDAEETLYPMGVVDPNRQDLYRQTLYAANTLSEGYYGWRYRGMQATNFTDSSTLVFDPGLNAGTVAVQYFFSRVSSQPEWEFDVSEQGFFQTYLSLFGDPFRSAVEPLVPSDLQQPVLAYPFPAGEVWFYTGGPHGGYNSGSAWAAIDFAPPAPPDDLIAREGYCYISPYYATAAAPGVVARSGDGYVILDLDFDGNEHTGWTLVYLHLSSQDVVQEGTRVNTGDKLGRPSCEGGFSTATHLHFARRYNGEWIPADCQQCTVQLSAPPMVLSNWRVYLLGGQEYQGTLVHTKTDELRRAEQGREDPINQVQHQ